MVLDDLLQDFHDGTDLPLAHKVLDLGAEVELHD